MASRRTCDRIARRARHVGLDLDSTTVTQLEGYLAELSRWNSKINLTAFRLGDDPTEDAIDRLVLEPALAAKHLPPNQIDVIDLGSGGGSPAVPMKIVRPDLRLTMVEVKVRKCAFLRQLVRRLALEDTCVENLRVEELLARPELHDRFYAATVRAVRLENPIWRPLISLLRNGGLVLHFTTFGRVQPPPPPFRFVATHALLEDSVVAVSEKVSAGRST